MSINSAGGTRIWVGSTLHSLGTAVDYAADSYTEINSVENLGEFGDESSPINFASLKDSRVQKLKGTRDAGNMSLVVGDDPTDPGQAMLNVIEGTKFDYNFKVQLNDALTVSGTGSIHYFRAKVMSKKRTVGTVNDVVKRNFTLALNSAIVDVAAT